MIFRSGNVQDYRSHDGKSLEVTFVKLALLMTMN